MTEIGPILQAIHHRTNTINMNIDIAEMIHATVRIIIHGNVLNIIILVREVKKAVQNIAVEADRLHTVQKAIQDITEVAANLQVIVPDTTMIIITDLIIEPKAIKIYRIQGRNVTRTNIHRPNTVHRLMKNWMLAAHQSISQRIKSMKWDQRAYHHHLQLYTKMITMWTLMMKPKSIRLY